MRNLLRQVDPIDVVALVSVAIVTIGIAQIFVPAAFIVAGGLGLVYAVAASRRATP